MAATGGAVVVVVVGSVVVVVGSVVVVVGSVVVVVGSVVVVVGWVVVVVGRVVGGLVVGGLVVGGLVVGGLVVGGLVVGGLVVGGLVVGGFVVVGAVVLGFTVGPTFNGGAVTSPIGAAAVAGATAVWVTGDVAAVLLDAGLVEVGVVELDVALVSGGRAVVVDATEGSSGPANTSMTFESVRSIASGTLTARTAVRMYNSAPSRPRSQELFCRYIGTPTPASSDDARRAGSRPLMGISAQQKPDLDGVGTP